MTGDGTIDLNTRSQTLLNQLKGKSFSIIERFDCRDHHDEVVGYVHVRAGE